MKRWIKAKQELFNVAAMQMLAADHGEFVDR